MTLEVVERLPARQATPERLARGGPEFRQHFRRGRAAARALDLVPPKQRPAAPAFVRRRDAVVPELAAPVFGHPIGGPGRGQHRAHPAGDARPRQGKLHLHGDHAHGGAARIGRRDLHFHPRRILGDAPQHPQVGDGQHRDFRVRDPGDGLPGPLRQGHQSAPGWVRCRCCISASRKPRCSVWRPVRPPRCIQPSWGRVRVDCASTRDTVRSKLSRSSAGSAAMHCSISGVSWPGSNISPV